MNRPDPLWLFADQLGTHFHSTPEHRDRDVVLIRSAAAFARRPFHRQKLRLVEAGMRKLVADLGDRAQIVDAPTYTDGLRRFGRPVVVHEPGSHAADALVRRLYKEGLVTGILATPGLILSKTASDSGRARALAPARGRDRRTGPGRAGSRGAGAPDSSCGRGRPRRFAVGRAEARRALHRFLTHRLPTFGPHQDAMLNDDWAMSHALLSVPLNFGLLDPLDVVRQADRSPRPRVRPPHRTPDGAGQPRPAARLRPGRADRLPDVVAREAKRDRF